MKIAIVTSEIVPYAKTGGLADVAGALARYLGERGDDVRVFTPLYDISEIDLESLEPVDELQELTLSDGSDVTWGVSKAPHGESGAEIWFVDAPDLFARGKIYTDDDDEGDRFALLSRAALESMQRTEWVPDVIHCNDWQSAPIPLYLRTIYAWDQLFADVRTVLTIHNLAYQGAFRASILDRIGFADADRGMVHQEDLGNGVFNFLKHGIMYADLVTTVSRTYAHEITTPEYGEGLDRLLAARGEGLVGIVNGVDYDEWSPEKDRYIAESYTADDPSGKEANRQNLLDRLELPYDPEVPIFGIVSRLVTQKGFDLFEPILDQFLTHVDMRLCVLGSGQKEYEDYFAGLQSRYPDKVCFWKGYSNELAHLIEAGSDIFLMPSRYEPCGLNQIYSLRYGTIPIVRRTGGLADTVTHFDRESKQGNGFVFDDFNAQGLAWAIDQALQVWGSDDWHHLVANAMSADWSWERQIERYVELYERIAVGV